MRLRPPRTHLAPSWARCRAALRKTPTTVWNDSVTDWAAALTYYAILTVLPTLTVIVTVIGLANPSGTEDLIRYAVGLAPAESGSALSSALHDVARGRSAAWLLTVAGTASAVWSACSYLSVFRRALYTMHGATDTRPVRRRAWVLVVTALLLLSLLVSSAVALVVTGPVARALGRGVGLGEPAAAVWDVLRWPFLVCVAALLVLLLFRSAPPEWRSLARAAPGGVLAGVLWLLSSAGFALYASHAAGAYNRLYGSLAGVVVFLIWLWFSNLALLFGAQFNALLAHGARTAAAPDPPPPPTVQQAGKHAPPQPQPGSAAP